MITWADFYSLQRFGMTPDLANIQLFCEHLGHPEASFPSVHVGGTNGKGSVVAILDSVLRAAGLRVGMYTSPHLVRFEERIRVGGIPIPEAAVFAFLDQHWDFIRRHRCTFFETATALAFDYLRQQNVELAVVEVGLGGRYDATRVVNSILSIITRIDLDHTDRLGTTFSEIAADKAGIFRSGSLALISEQNQEAQSTLERSARQIEVLLHCAEDIVALSELQITPLGISGKASFNRLNAESLLNDWQLPLTGFFQIENLKVSLAAIDLLKSLYPCITIDAIRQGINSVTWLGRLQRLQSDPEVILDVGHNPGAVRAALKSVKEIWNPRRIIAVFSALQDKDVVGMMRILKENVDDACLTPLATYRGSSLSELTDIAKSISWKTQLAENPDLALQTALTDSDRETVILVIGSHALVGEVLKKRNFA
ncbi:MAG: folylpolyglutamate synthase/dihydrofolate synthase family protein [bacterium]